MNARANHSCVVLRSGGKLQVLDETRLDEIDRLRASDGTLVWLDIADPQDDDIGLLEREFGLHALAVEDLRKRRQRPKMDTYRDQHVIVTYEVLARADERPTDERPTDGRPIDGRPIDERPYDLAEIHLFAGKGYLVSVHWADSPALDDVRGRLQQRAEAIGDSAGALLYAVLDAVVDGYFPLLDGLSDRIDTLEEQIVSGEQSRASLRDVLLIKRELLELRRVLAPQRDVANQLLRRDVGLIDDAAAPYYQDLYDHLIRVLESVDLYRDLVSATLDANLSVTSNNLNTVMKRLTALTVVLILPTLVASIYGMNFQFIPGLDSPVGFWASLIGMGLLMLIAAAYFKVKDWF